MKMLLTSCDMADHLYNPINHLTQAELMEKFNLAFYEAQNLTKNDIISTFNETNPETTLLDETSDDCLIDYLISNDDTPASTPNSAADVNFDFNDFVADFDQNLSQSGDFDTETFATESTRTESSLGADFSQFFVPPPFAESAAEDADDDELIDIDLCEELESSLDFDGLRSEFEELGERSDAFDDDGAGLLPPVATITRTNVDFNNFLRRASAERVAYSSQDSPNRSDFGHLIGSRLPQPSLTSSSDDFFAQEDNHMVLTQADALLNDDPLLSSSSLSMACAMRSNDCEEVTSSTGCQCKWEGCYQVYESQTALVRHIEKCHVELKRGEEFTCFWDDCPRKTKPFNARYKLLIHMRVHSGEKPNKCPFDGCNKAFSRLENLKIHQRSHTGERPYLCQFTSCTKSFSNSSDRAKHQRTHFDTKPYACQVYGCTKKYTDPSSLRKHVKNHSLEEQIQIKRRSNEDGTNFITQSLAKKFLDPTKQKAVKEAVYYTNFDHSYSNTLVEKKCESFNIKRDLKNKLSEKSRLRKGYC